MEELNIKTIDSIILSFPKTFYDKSDMQFHLIHPIWSVIEDNLEKNTISSAGVSDFSKIYLEQFCESIINKQHLPALNQVNLSTCCKIPDDLLEFAKLHNIQLTTHNDMCKLIIIDCHFSCYRSSGLRVPPF
jgi:glutamate--cysteine ligase regulatory subunit